MKKREKMPKVRVTKHGNMYIPPVKELQKPIYVNCPECGETWTGYKEQMDCDFFGSLAGILDDEAYENSRSNR